jgi:hypothetical protein
VLRACVRRCRYWRRDGVIAGQGRLGARLLAARRPSRGAPHAQRRPSGCRTLHIRTIILHRSSSQECAACAPCIDFKRALALSCGAPLPLAHTTYGPLFPAKCSSTSAAALLPPTSTAPDLPDCNAPPGLPRVGGHPSQGARAPTWIIHRGDRFFNSHAAHQPSVSMHPGNALRFFRVKG